MPKTLVASRLHDTLSHRVWHPHSSKDISLRDFLQPCVDIESPVISGLVSMFARSLPFLDLADANQALQEGIQKELAAAADEYHPVSFSWDPLFSTDHRDRSRPIAPGYPIDEHLHTEIHRRFQLAKRKISSMLFYPDYSRKTLGTAARVETSKYADRLGEFEEDLGTTLGLEKIYHSLGVQVHGRTEMRYAWKYNDLQPRVYYARGPNQYYTSRYIQEVFNVFVDAFPMTHRFTRFFTTSVQGSPLETAGIYDYSSFTSLLNEIRNWTSALADFCHGTPVTIVDTSSGIVTLDLGDMVRDFNNACNLFPQFDVSGIAKVFDPDEEELIRTHTCGMLGVAGNISSCTLVHGLHLAVLLGSLEKSKVVGDDAFYWKLLSKAMRQELAQDLSSIGRISLPKMEFWPPPSGEDTEDRAWHYVKRPIERFEDHIITGKQVVWPSYMTLLGRTDSLHTVRTPDSLYTELKRFSSMMLSFVLQLSRYELSQVEIDYVDRFIRAMNSLRKIREYEDQEGVHFLYPKSFSSRPVKDELLHQHWNTVISVPVDMQQVPSQEDETVARGIPHIGSGRRSLKLMRDLNYASVDPLTRRILVRDHPETVLKMLSKEIKPVYDIVVFSSCPDWMWNIYYLEVTGSSPVSLLEDLFGESDGED